MATGHGFTLQRGSGPSLLPATLLVSRCGGELLAGWSSLAAAQPIRIQPRLRLARRPTEPTLLSLAMPFRSQLTKVARLAVLIATLNLTAPSNSRGRK